MSRTENQKEKDRKYSKQWRIDNPEKVKAYRKLIIERTARNNREYYKKNKEKIKEVTREYQKEYQKNYQRNAGKKKLTMRKRAYQTIRKQIINDRKCCEFCDSNEFLELHHKNYESNDIDNFILLCRKCHKKVHSKYNKEKSG